MLMRNVTAYSAEMITDVAGLRAISSAWQNLHAATESSPFSDINWILAWAEHFWDADVEARIATVWDGDILVAALPLRLETRKVSRRVPVKTQILTTLYDYRVGCHDIMIREGHPDAASRLVDLCLETGAPFLDLNMLRPSPGLRAFRNALGERWRHERVEIRNSHADLSKGWDGYCAARSSNTRKSLRKIDRKLNEAGARLVTVTREDADWKGVLDDVFVVSSRSWKAKNGTDIGSQDKDRAYYRSLFDGLADRSTMLAHVLYVGGAPVAAVIAVDCDGTAYGLVTDYDDAHAKSGVGRKITWTSVQEAVARGNTTFDMLRKTHFTQTFSDDEEGLLRLRVELRPGPARWIVSGEFALRAAVERLIGDKKRVTGRRKFFGERG